jgi:hypothetical protein
VSKKLGVIVGVLALFAAIFVPQAVSDVWNKKTVITVNETLQVPGATLQPGKYVFKLADSQSNRHIVQIFNEDESQVITTILAIPNYRLQPTGDTHIELWETPQGSPQALRAWFYPGDNFGQEFAYPKDEATALSASTNQQVPSMSDEDMSALSKSQESMSTQPSETASAQPTEQPAAAPEVTPAPEATQVQPEQQAEVTPAPEPHQETPAVQPEPQPEIQQEEPAREQASTEGFRGDELPRTAGYLPLLGLTGLLSLGAATLIRAGRS